MPYQSLNPASGDLLKSFPKATAAQLEVKSVAASACFAVWRHKSYAELALKRVETGMMFVNNLDRADADLPFGGVKTSGYGRELGDMGSQQFVNKKLVRILAAEAPAVSAAPEKRVEPVGETA